jgi:dihydroorotate dehydrogenase electron transfer subunit
MAMQEICKVCQAECLADGLYRIQMQAPALSAKAAPGQFVHIACGEGNMLRRPISICDVRGDIMTIVFAVKGEGTRWLAKRKIGEELDVLGPLGHGFDLSALGSRPVFIGGGIGVPPMLYALKAAKAQGCQPEVILGFRNKSAVILQQEFEREAPTFITTDDGSYGTAGFVSDILQQRLGEYTSVCCCGPKKMLQTLAGLAEGAGIPCQVSMEERMGCGIGACLVCACALKGKGEETRYGHVCKDGPVFDSKEVVW